jgi:NADH-quinone oxidoreductase subunit J
MGTESVVTVAFYTFGLVAVGGAVGTVSARRLVHGVLFLLASFLGVAAIYLLLGADFLMAVQVLVYAGAVTILMLFAIMLTPGQVETHQPADAPRRLGAGLVGAAFLGVAAYSLFSTRFALAGARGDSPTTEAIGRTLLGAYALPFEMASVLLLAAMVGAIMIARDD